MVIDQIKNIDQNADNQIDGKELLEALKPNGFLSKEDNLTKLGNLLNNGETEGNDKELLNSLRGSFYRLKDEILRKEDITDEDAHILNAYIKVLGGKGEECREIQIVINRHNVQKIMEKESVSAEDICILQDYMSKLGEDLEKILIVQDFIEWYDIQKLMQECKNKGRINSDEQKKIDAYMDKLGLNNNELQTPEQAQRLEKIQEFLSLQGEIDKIYSIYKKLDKNSQNLLSDLLGLGTNVDLVSMIDSFLSGDIKLNTENEIKGVNVLNKLIKENPYRQEKLQKIVNDSVISMMTKINEIIAANNNYNNPELNYKKEEVMAIQLWANVCYGANLNIDGQRNGVYGVGEDNKGMTNLYIYRLELKTRGEMMNFRNKMNMKEFGNLLNIPNLDTQLSLLPEASQNKVLEKFLDFFLDIKQGGMHFENHIGSENFQKVLNNLINAERYKDITVEDYYRMYKDEDLDQDEIDQIETEFQEMKARYHTMGEYFEELATSDMQKMSADDKNFREYNHQLALSNKINKFYKLYAEIVGFKGDERQKQKLKQEFAKIAKEILKNERLTGDQENSITEMIGAIFSDIPGEGKYNTVDIYYSRGNNPYNISQIYWDYSPAPKSIKYTKSCNVKVEYKEDGSTSVNMTLKLDGVELKISGKSLNELRNFTHNGVKYDIHYDEGDSTCLIISKVGEGSELQSIFGDDVYQKYQNRQKALYDKREENKETLDISAQVESTDPMQLKSIDWTRTDSTTDYGKKVLDFKSRINDETGYTERFENYSAGLNGMTYANTQYATSLSAPEQPHYKEYYELSIPGCKGKLVHIDPKEYGKIKNAITKYPKSICFVPRDKKNQKIYELKLSDLKISEKDDKGNIHLYEITSDLNKGKKIQTISAETIRDANNTNGLIMTSIDAAPGLQEAMDIVQEISDTMEAINKDYAKFTNQEMKERDLEGMYQKIIPLLKKIKELNKNYADTFSQLHRGLLEWKTNNASTISRNDESYINSLISNLDYLIGAIGPNSEIGKYCMSMFNEQSVYPNDTPTKRILHRLKNNGITLVSAIAGGVLAVCLMPATGGASIGVYLKMAMVMTAGGMVSGAGGQVLNETIQRQFTRKVGTIDGQPIYTTYNDPTSLEMAMNGDITRGEFALQTSIQFAIGSATTFGCMYAGSLVGGWLSKAAGSLKKGGIPDKICSRVLKLNKNFRVPDGDPVTQNMFESMATNIGRNQQSLIAKFNQEFFQELREEGSETGFEELGNALKSKNPKLAILCSGLSSLAMAWHCLTPGGNIPNIYKEQGVTVGTRKNDMDYNNKEFTITLEYNGDRQALIDYFKKNHYEEVGGCLKKKSDIEGFTNVIKLRETKVSTEQRSLAGSLSGYGIIIDTETGKGYYQNMSKIQELELSGKANVSIDPQTKKVTIISGETTLELEQDYFGGLSHKFDVNTTQALTNSKMMDDLVKSINEQNKSQKLQGLRETIRDQYRAATGQELELTDEQLLSVIEAHKQKGILGHLDPTELQTKHQILSETIKVNKVRRFLLEAGFCGKSELDIDLNEEVNQEWKNEARERLVRNQGNILEAQRALDFWAEGELGEYADIKMDITETVAKITKIRTALDTRLDGGIIEIEEGKILDTNKITTVEEFLELFQLGLNEGKTKVYDNYDKKWKKMENKSKMLLTRLYYESVYKPLGIEIFADPETTLGEHVDRKTFIDTKHYSEGFSISELSDFGTMRQQNNGVEFKTNNEIGNKILSEIAVIEGRNKAGQPSGTTIIETVNSEIESIQDSTEHTIAVELRASIQAHSEGKISSEDQAYLFAMTIKHMGELRTAYPDLSPEKVFNLLNSNQNKLLHQHLRDLNTITSSDHGIKHVLRGNATLAENVFTNLENEGVRNKLYRKKVQSGEINAEELTLDQFKAKMKVLTRQAIIDHDLGYTNKANRAFDENGFEDSFHMVSDHPLRSTIWVEENQEFYTEIFGEDGYDAIRESLPGHGSAQTNFMDKIGQGDASTKEIVRGILSCSDCAGSPADYKIATMFAQSGTIGQLFNVFTIYRSGDVQGTIRALENLATSINNMKPNPNFDIEAFKSGVSAFLFGGGINPDGTIEFGFKEKIDNAVDIFTNKGKEGKFRKKAEENLEKKGIAKSDQNYAQLLNAEFEKLCKLEMIDKLFGFKLGKFLGAFGLQTTLDAEGNPRGRLEFRAEYDSNGNILYKQATNAKGEPIYDLNGNPVYEQKINEDGELVYDDVGNPVYEQKGKWGWSIDFELSGKSFELLAEQFGAGVALKSLIGVCDDYGINDKGPTSKFLESQIDQATKHRKHDGAKEGELINYIKQRLNPNHEALMVFNDKGEPTGESRTYKSEMEEFVNKFNEDGRKKVEKDKKNHEAPQDAEREEVQITDDLKFQQLKKQKDGSTTPVVESQITFSNDRIVISGPNNVEITLNFDGKSYEGFDETAGRFLEMNQKIDGHIKAIEDAKDNPALLYETAQAVIKDLEGYGDKVSKENPWIDVSGWKTVTQAIADIADEPVINYDELINKINEIRSTYEIKMQQVQSSNPTLNK